MNDQRLIDEEEEPSIKYPESENIYELSAKSNIR